MEKPISRGALILSVLAGLHCSPDNQNVEEADGGIDPSLQSELPWQGYDFSELFIIDADDPLLLIYEARLVDLLRKMRTRESIDLLLGQGSEITPDGNRIAYKLLPYFESAETEAKFEPFVEQVTVEYDEEGILTSIQVLDPSPVQNIGAKQQGFWESEQPR